jgi:hypothetical protein
MHLCLPRLQQPLHAPSHFPHPRLGLPLPLLQQLSELLGFSKKSFLPGQGIAAAGLLLGPQPTVLFLEVGHLSLEPSQAMG